MSNSNEALHFVHPQLSPSYFGQSLGRVIGLIDPVSQRGEVALLEDAAVWIRMFAAIAAV
jgi:hypothetical protein